MSDLQRRIERARGHVAVEWSESDVKARLAGTLQRRQRRTRARVVAALGAVSMLLALGAWRLQARITSAPVIANGAIPANPTPTNPAPANPTPTNTVPANPSATTSLPANASSTNAAPTPLRFADGSIAQPLDRASVLAVASSTPRRTVVALAEGGARFDVAHNPTRVFRIEAGPVGVEVLGTRFAVERRGERTRVAVESGRVRVLWADGEIVLTDGEVGLFPPLPPSASLHPAEAPIATARAIAPPRDETPRRRAAIASPPSPSPATPAATESPAASTRPTATATDPSTAPATANANAAARAGWQELARQGRFDQAYDALAHDAPRDAVEDAAELLLRSDVARRSGHPTEALAPLQRIVQHHPSDPRAPLAAFTLGRVLLDDLARPRDAAAAFRAAQTIAPDGAMAEDALAREVEAWSAASDTTEARRSAERYVARYPDGRRLRSVRRLGGLD